MDYDLDVVAQIIQLTNGQPYLVQRHDVITYYNNQYTYTVKLMRRWVAQRIENNE